MITVDWSIGGNTINYITARNRVGDVADVVAAFIDFLHSINHLRFNELHVIGHSLGYLNFLAFEDLLTYFFLL